MDIWEFNLRVRVHDKNALLRAAVERLHEQGEFPGEWDLRTPAGEVDVARCLVVMLDPGNGPEIAAAGFEIENSGATPEGDG